MLTLTRRFLVLVALMFWLGGFTFYAGVVVPIGQEVVGRSGQSLLTREVSNYLNLACAVTLVPLGWDVWSTADRSRRRQRWRWLCWTGILATLLLLYALRLELAHVLDGADRGWLPSFRAGHRLYLWLSTIQWGVGVAYVVLTLLAWRTEDRQTQQDRDMQRTGRHEESAVGFTPSPAEGTVRW